MEKQGLKNRYFFGLGTIGRDMVYTMVSMFLIVYYTEIIKISNSTLLWITGFMVAFRVFDALNDPIMGTIVDNTRTKWGKFKPFILFGGLLSGAFTILLFTDFQLQGAGIVALFSVIYLLWGMSFTVNDISYWSMMPALSSDQKEREKIGSFARICANIGLFAVVTLITPITEALGNLFNNPSLGYTVFAIIVVVLLWSCQLFTLFGVKEPRVQIRQQRTTLKGMLKALFKNDQLLVTAVAMALFMIGYMTTTSFGVYFFKYAYGDENMYSIFAVVLGVAQIVALILFPFFSKRFTRRTLYIASIIGVVVGYVMFFLVPMNMILIGIAGLFIFFFQAFIQLLMLVFLADTVEYGEWKLGKRNEAVSFAVQPFINKLGGAVGSGILGITLVLSGINGVSSAAEVTTGGIWIMKSAMLILPLILIVIGFLLYFFLYKIDKKKYEEILTELEIRRKEEADGEALQQAEDSTEATAVSAMESRGEDTDISAAEPPAEQ